MKLKPIHKFNGGDGATLCHSCSTIINIGLTKDLYCPRCEEVIKNFVPHNISVLLKEIGFDTICFGYYRNGKFKSIDSNEEMEHPEDEIVMAPTYQQAFDWFRERKFLVDITTHMKNVYEYYIRWNNNKSILSEEFKTIPEARTNCLLKLIEVFKRETGDLS